MDNIVHLGNRLPLFDAYPRLRERLPIVPLGQWPTPVQRLSNLESQLGSRCGALYMKRDDLSGAIYGGNKVRKLEFLLGRAVREKRAAVMTFGAAGSNHALATALYARGIGLRCISVLVPQPYARSVRRNLLMGHAAGAELHLFGGMLRAVPGSLALLAQCLLRDRRMPFLIPPGGSSPLGVVGFVNAAYELKRQVEDGVVPEPDFLYVASGTMGTAVGLMLGLRAAGLKTRVMAVRVTAPQFTSINKARALYEKTNRLLHAADPAFPQPPFPDDAFQFRHEFYGKEYGLYTEEGMRAVNLLRESEQLRVEGTYTGKTLAAVLADAAAGRLENKTVLFWNTYNSRDFSEEIAAVDYHVLPKELHEYFEHEVQPLDRQ